MGQTRQPIGVSNKGAKGCVRWVKWGAKLKAICVKKLKKKDHGALPIGNKKDKQRVLF
jgi:hypothetical protein